MFGLKLIFFDFVVPFHRIEKHLSIPPWSGSTQLPTIFFPQFEIIVSGHRPQSEVGLHYPTA